MESLGTLWIFLLASSRPIHDDLRKDDVVGRLEALLLLTHPAVPMAGDFSGLGFRASLD